MSRSFDQAKKAAEELANGLNKINGMDLDQRQALGFAPPPQEDPNAGLARYEDVVGAPPVPEEAMLEKAAEIYLQRQRQQQAADYQEVMRHKADLQRQQELGAFMQQAQPQPQLTPGGPDANGIVGMLMQQVQSLMQDNAQLRAQLMEALRNQAPAAPKKRQVLRAPDMTAREREEAEYSGAGLLG